MRPIIYSRFCRALISYGAIATVLLAASNAACGSSGADEREILTSVPEAFGTALEVYSDAGILHPHVIREESADDAETSIALIEAPLPSGG